MSSSPCLLWKYSSVSTSAVTDVSDHAGTYLSASNYCADRRSSRGCSSDAGVLVSLKAHRQYRVCAHCSTSVTCSSPSASTRTRTRARTSACTGPQRGFQLTSTCAGECFPVNICDKRKLSYHMILACADHCVIVSIRNERSC